MKRTLLPMLSLGLLALGLAMFGITACADSTAPHRDCTIVNGSQVCKPG